MKPTDVKTLSQNVFSAFDRDWMLLAAGDRQKANAMTVSWGGMGVLWGMDVATVYVRPQRYTYEFLERGDYFTLSAFDPGFRPQLALCGSKSGREVDKAAACGFTWAYGQGDAPYFQQARLVLVCKKLYFADFDPAHILDPQVDAGQYAAGDYHRMYIGQIVEALEA